MLPSVVEELYFFVKISSVKAVTLLNNVNEICAIFYTFHTCWLAFCIEGVYKNLWSECSFFENWVIEGYIFLMT